MKPFKFLPEPGRVVKYVNVTQHGDGRYDFVYVYYPVGSVKRTAPSRRYGALKRAAK